MLTSATRSILAGVESVIIDEVHAIAGSKRGAHLAEALPRLDHLALNPSRGAVSNGSSEVTRRRSSSAGDVQVEILEQGLGQGMGADDPGAVEDLGELGTGPGPDGSPTASIWPHVEARIVDLIVVQEAPLHHYFANSRRLAERLTARSMRSTPSEPARALKAPQAAARRLR